MPQNWQYAVLTPKRPNRKYQTNQFKGHHALVYFFAFCVRFAHSAHSSLLHWFATICAVRQDFFLVFFFFYWLKCFDLPNILGVCHNRNMFSLAKLLQFVPCAWENFPNPHDQKGDIESRGEEADKNTVQLVSKNVHVLVIQYCKVA